MIPRRSSDRSLNTASLGYGGACDGSGSVRTITYVHHSLHLIVPCTTLTLMIQRIPLLLVQTLARPAIPRVLHRETRRSRIDRAPAIHLLVLAGLIL